MIDITQQEEMFIAIGNILPRKIEAYAIGGTALMLMSVKNSTLDVDLVFDKLEERQEFYNSLKKLGAKESNVTLVYGLKSNTPLMLEFNNCRFDMFTNKIITSYFSDSMKKRATQTHDFGNLIIKVADPNDVFIMKSVTSRAKDMDDMIAIAKGKIDWDIIVKEAEVQVSLGNEAAILGLEEKLEKLNNNKAITVPKIILDKLWKLLHKQIKAKKKK